MEGSVWLTAISQSRDYSEGTWVLPKIPEGMRKSQHLPES